MWKNLAPDLVRQRLILEGTTETIVKPRQIKAFLLRLANVTKMDVISGPFAYSAREMGFGGWVHWKSSGAHFYSYPTSPPLFTVDLYTCKSFPVAHVVRFTRQELSAMVVVWKSIHV